MTVYQCNCCGASTGKASDQCLCPNCDGYVEVALTTERERVANLERALAYYADGDRYHDYPDGAAYGGLARGVLGGLTVPATPPTPVGGPEVEGRAMG